MRGNSTSRLVPVILFVSSVRGNITKNIFKGIGVPDQLWDNNSFKDNRDMASRSDMYSTVDVVINNNSPPR
jgi:hypothetical protein